MSNLPELQIATREAKNKLDEVAVVIELTLISIIQAMALGVLVTFSIPVITEFQLQYWPYVVLGLLAILIFWSRTLIHTLSFIGWPLEMGHTYIYFGATLVEGLALSQVNNPANWYALNTVYFALAWFLYYWDRRVMMTRATEYNTETQKKLHNDMIADQERNLKFFMPAGVVFHAVAWWLVVTFPTIFIDHYWHVALALWSVGVGIWYLGQGAGILHRRQNWILARYTSQRLPIVKEEEELLRPAQTP
ncbi:MAG: hypothetical protein U0641_15340 [Anaerolineae bacterium]